MISRLPKALYYSLIALSLSFALKILLYMGGDYDLWMHLFFGSEILKTLSIPSTDIYSFTAYGSTIVNHEWLSQIILYSLHDCFGNFGLLIFKLIFFCLSIYIAWKIIASLTENRLARVVSLIFMLLVFRAGVAFRIQMFSYLFLYFIIYLETVKYKKRIYLYPFLFLFWANLHGAFVLGLVVIGIFQGIEFLKSRSLKPLIIIALSTIVTLINPYGFNLWLYIYKELTLTVSSQYITEWQAFSFKTREIAFFVAFLLCSLGLLLKFKKFKPAHVLLMVLSAYLGFSAVRHTPIFAILALPALTIALANLLKEKPVEDTGNLGKITSYVFYLLSFSLCFISIPKTLELKYEEPMPEKTVAFLKEKNIKGNMILPLHLGGYVMYHLYPNIKVSIDGRWATIYSQETMKDSHDFSYNSTNGAWKNILRKYDANYVLLEKSNPAYDEIIKSKHAAVVGNELSYNLLNLLK